MTTIAYDHDNGIIAYDSRLTAFDEIITDDHEKKVVNDSGVWFGTGKESDLPALYRGEYVKGMEAAALKVCKDGIVWLVLPDHKNSKLDFCKLTYSYALGSGSGHAQTAFDLDQSAHTAVWCAIKRDSSSGGRIRKYKVKR